MPHVARAANFPNMSDFAPTWVLGVLSVLAAIAVVTTAWSVAWDLRAYRRWKGERTGDEPRWKRRQQQKNADDEEQDARRWRWHILALQGAAGGFVVGSAILAAGYLMQLAWLLLIGGNLFVIGLFAWIAYQLVLPKPRALKNKRLPKLR